MKLQHKCWSEGKEKHKLKHKYWKQLHLIGIMTK